MFSESSNLPYQEWKTEVMFIRVGCTGLFCFGVCWFLTFVCSCKNVQSCSRTDFVIDSQVIESSRKSISERLKYWLWWVLNVNNNDIVVCKCKNCVIPTNIDSCRNIGHKLGDFVLNVTGLQVWIFFFLMVWCLQIWILFARLVF